MSIQAHTPAHPHTDPRIYAHTQACLYDL